MRSFKWSVFVLVGLASAACAGPEQALIERDRARLASTLTAVVACEQVDEAVPVATLAAELPTLEGDEIRVRGVMRRGAAVCTARLCQDCFLGICRPSRCCNGCGGVWTLAAPGGEAALVLSDVGAPDGLTWGAQDCAIEADGPLREVVATGVVVEAETSDAEGPLAGRALRLHGLCAVGGVQAVPPER